VKGWDVHKIPSLFNEIVAASIIEPRLHEFNNVQSVMFDICRKGVGGCRRNCCDDCVVFLVKQK
jgi:hypothetical protein